MKIVKTAPYRGEFFYNVQWPNPMSMLNFLFLPTGLMTSGEIMIM